MPKPKYIVCAESALTDKATNLVSLIHVLEGYTVTPMRPDGQAMSPAGIGMMKFVGVAVWERSDDDEPGEEFEHRLFVSFPNGPEREISVGKFTMDRRFHRFSGTILKAPDFEIAAGEIVFESAVRKIGGDWVSQRYTIPIEVNSLSEES